MSETMISNQIRAKSSDDPMHRRKMYSKYQQNNKYYLSDKEKEKFNRLAQANENFLKDSPFNSLKSILLNNTQTTLFSATKRRMTKDVKIMKIKGYNINGEGRLVKNTKLGTIDAANQSNKKSHNSKSRENIFNKKLYFKNNNKVLSDISAKVFIQNGSNNEIEDIENHLNNKKENKIFEGILNEYKKNVNNTEANQNDVSGIITPKSKIFLSKKLNDKIMLSDEKLIKKELKSKGKIGQAKNYQIEINNKNKTINIEEDNENDKKNNNNLIQNRFTNLTVSCSIINFTIINSTNINSKSCDSKNNKFNTVNLKNNVSANSNKNSSDIIEQIDVAGSNGKLEALKDNSLSTSNNNNKKSAWFQSLSNNLEIDSYKNRQIKGKNINFYLGETIYEGTMSIAYKSLNLDSGEIFCAKRYIDKKNLEIFKNEVEIYELINNQSENIINFYGSDEFDDEQYFLYMEYVNCDNLKRVIETFGGNLNEKLIKVYTKQILQALDFLHNVKKIVHRDIKCSNILIDKKGIIKLIDFGCSGILNKNKSEDENNPFQGVKGTLPWCAPEVILNKKYGTKCDIWSLGCTLIEMGGMEPWNKAFDNYYQCLNIIGKSENIPEIPSQFSNELKNFIELCLQKDPEKRPDAKQLLNHFFILGTQLANHSEVIF